ncbi:MAG: class I SAM-dependent methyltransferase [Phaeodactylibacter sp.]|nr:class I SAM-dependent methyltransferase [Phaeodactylibacter sp.]
MSESSFYQSPLARVHNQSYGQHARLAAQELLRQLGKQGHQQGLIVGLGCGSGILEEAMSREGYDVLGVDYSTALIGIARQRCPQGQFHVGALMDFEIPPCLAVTAVGEVLNYRFDERHQLENLLPLFERIYRSLQPGGIFLFDIIEPGIADGTPPVRLLENEHWDMALNFSEDKNAATLQREITLYLKEGALYRKSKEVHRLNLYRKEAVQQLLEQAGFAVATTSSFAGQALRRHHVGFVVKSKQINLNTT